MSTFTKSEGAALVKVDPQRVLADINPNIYSGFVGHLGRCVYGGIVQYDSKKPGLTNEKGYRVDVADALKELRMPVVRYPGGNFVSAYHWLDGVGPKDKRPRRPELAWLSEESNEFGTDEFMEWCEFMKVEPYLCLNMGTGTLDEALGWLEYCNSDADTYYANLRRKNGHEKPYNVKYWGLGNEVYGDWQVGQYSDPIDYTKKALQWAKALKYLDPSIKLISCGENGFSKWDHIVTYELIKYLDFHSIHLYTYSKDHYKNTIQPLAAEHGIKITANLLKLAKISKGVPDSKASVAFDEWNVWDSEDCNQPVGVEQNYDLSDALAFTIWLNVFIRQAEHLGMCNLAQCVNVIAPVMTTKEGLFLQTIYQPLRLFSHHMRGKALDVHVTGPAYNGDFGTKTEGLNWVKGVQPDVSLLDTSSAVQDGTVSISVTNISLDDDITATIHLEGDYEKDYKRFTLYHDNVRAKNDMSHPDEVKLSASTKEVPSDFNFTFKKHSWTMLQFTLKR